jgi:transcriptional regulator with XRE-family HTH domain
MPLDADKPIDPVGQRLRQLRELLGLTQLDVAKRLKVGQTVISRIERRSDLLLSTIRSYLIAVGGSLDMRAVLETGAAVQLDAIASKSNENGSSDQLTFPDWPALVEPASKDVVFSIHPGHADKILKGEKPSSYDESLRRSLSPEDWP